MVIVIHVIITDSQPSVGAMLAVQKIALLFACNLMVISLKFHWVSGIAKGWVVQLAISKGHHQVLNPIFFIICTQNFQRTKGWAIMNFRLISLLFTLSTVGLLQSKPYLLWSLTNPVFLCLSLFLSLCPSLSLSVKWPGTHTNGQNDLTKSIHSKTSGIEATGSL